MSKMLVCLKLLHIILCLEGQKMKFKGCVYKYTQIIILLETLNFLTGFSMSAITVS